MKNIYSIAYRLYVYRKDNGMKQAQLAELLDISVRYYHDLENGKATNPSFRLMVKIHKVCGIDLNELAEQITDEAE